jgi:hypothetical protein
LFPKNFLERPRELVRFGVYQSAPTLREPLTKKSPFVI